jgi:hypothetical protein
MRPSDLEDADLHATEHELIAAVDAGTIGFESHGSDAIWQPPEAARASLAAAA